MDHANKSWIYLTPTVHALLEHAPELVEANNGGYGKVKDYEERKFDED